MPKIIKHRMNAMETMLVTIPYAGSTRYRVVSVLGWGYNVTKEYAMRELHRVNPINSTVH